VFRLKDIALVGGQSAAMDNKGGAAGNNGGTMASSATSVGFTPFTVGDLVLAIFDNGSDFWHKQYAPGKIMNLGSEATKGECQLISLGEGSSATNWTKDIISKWHVAAKEELKDGMVVLYADEDPTKTTSWRPGVVVLTDELYKDIVSIKGRWKEINKVNYKWVAIIDAPRINAPE
jgi:hypothetical protein